MNIELKVIDQRLLEWGLPAFQSKKAAALDLFACIDEPLALHPAAPAVLISSGFALHIGDANVAAIIAPRSGSGHKRGLVLGNTIGVVDADYTGAVFISAWNRNASGDPIVIQPGERVAQLLFVPVIRPSFEVVEDFSVGSDRGAGGFGSTGA